MPPKLLDEQKDFEAILKRLVMNRYNIKALTFDTGGTILDWHTGFRSALSKLGKSHNIERDWPALANELRRKSLKRILNLGEHQPPPLNFDDSHRLSLDELCSENGLEFFDKTERESIWWDAAHNFKCWPDFPNTLPRLRQSFICASFTILSYRLIIDTARVNELSWDAVISCEGIGKYKVLPEAYHSCAKFLQLNPKHCMMVACHNFDLDAAKAVGFKTAFVRRPNEWGEVGPPDPNPNPDHDIIVDSFPELAQRLGVSL